MRGRRRVFAVEPERARGAAGEALTRGCVVPGVTSTYRRIPDAAPVPCAPDPRDGGGELNGRGAQAPLLTLASRDSGVEVAVGDISLGTSLGLSRDSLDLEPLGSPAPLAVEPPAQLNRLLASRKLEQVLERSRQLPRSPAGLSRHRRCLRPLSQPQCEAPLFRAGEQRATEAETDLEAGVGNTEVVGRLEPEAWAIPAGQGLRYLEHLCLVLEHVARLQQLCLQLQTQQRPRGDPGEEESALPPSPSPSPSPGTAVQETGGQATSPPKAGCLGAYPPGPPAAPAEQGHAFPSSQGPKRELSHWDQVKGLLNRICWRSPRHPEPPGPPAGPASGIQSRNLSERPQCCPNRKTQFVPSLVTKKQGAKNLSIC
ncbi:uncharacterized protein C8orf58 homolog isoform X1 [Dasypus novemcinctus]|uniref:uncharacterized protein C8orf58 homolog isoform X1 n=1 Tax=Dasypus novemcinctus TaxID=9361 RepID=UPI00265DB3CA|nr:uncharacterized protein C8orf58 homolog isoform X1 [Dasypus novemcinctus]